MIRLIIFAIIGIILARVFWNSPKPKKSKPVATITFDSKPESKPSMLTRIFGGSNGEDEQAYNKYIQSHSGVVKSFYCVRRYSMRKTGHHAFISAYIVKPENYYGYIQVISCEVLENEIEQRLMEIIRRSYPKAEIVISKLR